jgi:hypothetical protein
MERKQELKENMQTLIDLTESCSELSEKLNKLKNQKKEIEEETIEILEQMNMQDTIMKLNNYKIQQKKTIQYQSMSLKYIQNCLIEHFEKDAVDNIMEILKTHRDKKEKTELKLFSLE